MSQVLKVALVVIVCVGVAAAIVWQIDAEQHKPPAAPKVYAPAAPPPAPPLIPGTSLTEKPVDLDISDATKPVDPVVFFEAPTAYEDSPIVLKVTGLLRRELYRQGVLLAARHELGLAPRDALLGETAPADIRQFNRVRVDASFMDYFPARLKIEFGPPAAARVVWHAESLGGQPEESFAQAVTAAETLSRGKYVDALKRTGLRGAADKYDPNGRVPEAVEARLRKMTVHDHFAALRELHALVKAEGESPAALTALARAYANLAMLTDRQWDAMPWVFKARALLYAERLRARDPAAPAGHWARAYAAALVGLHKVALDDFAAAEKVRGGVPPPAWAGLADALCRFDTARLEKVADDDPLADTAAVFRFLTLENPYNVGRARAAAKVALARVPECYRVSEAVEDYEAPADNPVADRPAAEVFLEAFPDRVRKMPGLPAAVADRAAGAGPEQELIRKRPANPHPFKHFERIRFQPSVDVGGGGASGLF